MHKKLIVSSIAAMLACGAGTAVAAPDWGKVPSKKITVFYPGVSPIEWITKGTEHGGAKGLKKGESCASCHDEEAADMGKKMATGQKLEPNVIKGKAGSIPVTVQAANDGTNLYMRFTWKQPAASGGGADKENPVKLAIMLEDNKVERANLSGCWETCHQDVRTMPGVSDDKKTKYVTGGSVASGKYYDLLQWKSKANKGTDGYVADKREMTGGTALIEAKGEKKGDTWTVTFARKFTGGSGDVALAAGKTINFGMAIHDDHTHGRFHHVSMGYSLGIDTKADITAVKQ
jgi:hypothetical protein